MGQIYKGRAYRVNGRLVQQPYNFTTANNLPLQAVTNMLRAILFPNAVPAAQRFNLSPQDYAFLRRYLHSTPHNSRNHLYTAPGFFDAYKKYLYYGRQPTASSRPTLRIYNVVGMSHGYLADVAYFADSTQHTEFMLSTVLYVNKNGVLNDGVYEYTTIGLPFLQQLGKAIYQYEIKRTRTFKPSFAHLFEE